MSSGSPSREPAASLLPGEVGDPGVQCSAGNPPAASAAEESSATRTAKRQLATYIKGPEDEQPRAYGRTRSQTRQISGTDAGAVESRAAKDLDDATRRVSALLATADMEQKAGGPIGRHRRDVESEPQSYRWVRDSANRELWEMVMQQEFEGLEKNGTFTPAELPPGRKAVGAKWVYKSKTNQLGDVVKPKARMCALGNLQKEDIDFLDTFSPTPVASSIRMIAALALQCDLKLTHLDVQQAFVQSSLDEEVYLRLPQGCGDKSGNIVRLSKTLYGLRQSPRVWNRYLVSKLKDFGSEQCLGDPCTFRLKEERNPPKLG